MKKGALFILILFLMHTGNAQTTTAYLHDDIAGNFCGIGVSGSFRTLGTSSWKFTRQAPFTGNNFYKIYNQAENNDCDFNNPGGSKVWSADLGINTLGTIFNYTDNNGSAGKFPVSNGKYYTLTWKDVGITENSEGTVMETSGSPVSLNSAVQSPVAANVFDMDNVQVTVTLSTAPSPEELFYLRYSTDNFASYGTLVTATPVSNSVSFTIPAQASGTVIHYYIFSSTIASVTLNGNQGITDLSTINFIRNGAVNFSYTVQSSLPVRFISFSGNNSHNGVLLKWSVASESDIREYRVERSYEGPRFNTRGIVMPARNSSSVIDYQFTDTGASGNLYYRIAALGLAGEVYRTTTIRTGRAINVSLYPNPASKEIWISVTDPRSIRQIEIVSLTGQRLMILRAATNPALSGTTIRVNIEKLTAAFYYVRVIGKEDTESVRFVKL
jgi:hypothetical protein